jgi:Exotoxin A catalytic
MKMEGLKRFEAVDVMTLKDQNPQNWPRVEIDEMFQWAKSLNQFRSFLTNMDHHDWRRYREAHASGEELVAKAARLQGIVKIPMPKGQLGYHGCTAAAAKAIKEGIKRQPQLDYEADWKAFYVGSSPEHSAGYIDGSNPKDGGAILNINNATPLTRIYISKTALHHARTSKEKAELIKQKLGMSTTSVLMDELGRRNEYIEMEDSDGHFETIIPWRIAERSLQAEDSEHLVEYDRARGAFILTG